MSKSNRYVVYCFIGGKCVGTHYSNDIAEIPYIKAIYKGCEVEVYRLSDYHEVSKEILIKPALKKQNKKKSLRRVKVAETGEVFSSLHQCCKVLSIPYKAAYTAIKKGRAVRGYNLSYIELV